MTKRQVFKDEEKFVRMNPEKPCQTFTVRITPDLGAWFLDAKKTIKQPKNSTAIKQLAEIGYKQVLHDETIKHILETVVNSSSLNERQGITDSDYNLDKN